MEAKKDAPEGAKGCSRSPGLGRGSKRLLRCPLSVRELDARACSCGLPQATGQAPAIEPLSAVRLKLGNEVLFTGDVQDFRLSPGHGLSQASVNVAAFQAVFMRGVQIGKLLFEGNSASATHPHAMPVHPLGPGLQIVGPAAERRECAVRMTRFARGALRQILRPRTRLAGYRINKGLIRREPASPVAALADRLDLERLRVKPMVIHDSPLMAVGAFCALLFQVWQMADGDGVLYASHRGVLGPLVKQNAANVVGHLRSPRLPHAALVQRKQFHGGGIARGIRAPPANLLDGASLELLFSDGR